MNNSRPAAFFSVAGTDLALLSRPDEAPIWVKTRRSMSLSLWQHQIAMVDRVKPAGVSYRDDLQHFRFQTSDEVSLAWYLDQRGQLPVDDPILMAQGLLNLLDQWHRRAVAVLSLTPQHLLLHPGNATYWLADWSLAFPYKDGSFDALKNHLTNEVTPFASPEQTGKTDLPVDYRSDYFSLGVLLYRISTGQLPFDAPDNASVVYRILTYEPAPAHILNTNLSAGFGAILAKLMAKNPADRYQSTDGLRYDLAWLLQAAYDPATFRPGEADSQGEFLPRPQLMGRQAILETVGKLIQEADNSQQKGVALLIGPSGSGKTALLNELENRLFADHFVLVSDLRDDQTQPYVGLRAAIDTLADNLLGQTLAIQNDFNFHLRAQLGSVLSVLTDFSPGLIRLTGEVDTPQAVLTGSANQDRLAYVLAGFLRALVLTGRPVVWLIDDLHDASDATLRLLDSLAREALLTKLTLVAATSRRDADVSVSNQRIQAFMDRLGLLGDSLTTVQTLTDLTEADLTDWLLTLHIDPETVAHVATAIHRKTGGNPFAVQRLLQQLTEQQAPAKAEGGYFFTIDSDWLAAYQAADNLLDYLTDQVEKLPADVRYLFDLMACFRQPARVSELAALADATIDSVQDHLAALQAAGLVIPKLISPSTEPVFAFANPQLTTIGRHLLRQADRQDAFVKAAMYIQHHDDLTRNDTLFQFAATALELPRHQSGPFAETLLQAGKKAAAIGANELALRCYDRVTDLFTEADWSNRFDACFAVYSEYLVTATYAENKRELFDQLVLFMTQKARHREDMALLHYTSGLGLIHQQRSDEAILTTLPVLHSFDIDMPLEPSKLTIITHSIRATLLVRNKTIDQLERLPDTTDSNARLVIGLLGNMGLASALVRPKMIPIIMYHDLRNSMQFGLTAESGAGFLLYALVQTSYQDKFRVGADMTELGLRLSRRFGSVTTELSCDLVKAIYIHHWVAPYQECIDLLQVTYRRSRENGLLTNAFNALGTATLMSVFSQLPLEVVFQRGLEAQKLINTPRESLPQIFCRITLQVIHDLQQPQVSAQFMTGTFADIADTESYLHREKQVSLLATLNVIKLFWGVHLRQRDMLPVLDTLIGLKKVTLRATFHTTFSYFYGGLICLQQPGPMPRKYRKLVQEAIGQLDKFSQVFAGNCRSRYFLLLGYYQIRQGHIAKGLAAIDQAIELAIHNGQIVEQALAHEIKGRHYQDADQPLLGQYAIAEAARIYGNWGALAVVARLKTEFPFLVTDTATESVRVIENAAGSGQIDLISFLKSSTTISDKLKLGDLLTNLLGVVLENAGAQKAALLLQQHGELNVFALKETSAPISLKVVELARANLPQNPIRYVARTGKPLVLMQAYTDRMFSADTYFQQQRTLSVLVMPVIKNEQLLAVIYLENNSTPGAFNSRRLEVLQLLSSQIAISLENAMLYDDMEGRVQERTRQLQQEMDTSEALLLNILPKAVAEELKQTGRAAARQFDNVTVLFTDFVNFTRIAEQMEPEDLVAELDYCFGEFDRITDRCGLEKIKTIGDAYLCAGGLTGNQPDHTADTVRAALMIRQFIDDRKQQRETDGKLYFEIRIGVHNGPLVAGVVGTRKFAYDIWGDTVNTAARMEQSSEPGRVNVSGRTWQAIQGQFHGQFRGQITAKNKGAIDMYFVDGIHETDSALSLFPAA